MTALTPPYRLPSDQEACPLTERLDSATGRAVLVPGHTRGVFNRDHPPLSMSDCQLPCHTCQTEVNCSLLFCQSSLKMFLFSVFSPFFPLLEGPRQAVRTTEVG